MPLCEAFKKLKVDGFKMGYEAKPFWDGSIRYSLDFIDYINCFINAAPRYKKWRFLHDECKTFLERPGAAIQTFS